MMSFYLDYCLLSLCNHIMSLIVTWSLNNTYSILLLFGIIILAQSWFQHDLGRKQLKSAPWSPACLREMTNKRTGQSLNMSESLSQPDHIKPITASQSGPLTSGLVHLVLIFSDISWVHTSKSMPSLPWERKSKRKFIWIYQHIQNQHYQHIQNQSCLNNQLKHQV